MAGRKLPVPRSTPALAALVAAGVSFTPRPYPHIDGVTAYGLEAAAALGVDPDRVFKTLMTSADGDLVTAVVPVSGSLDLKALARALRARRVTLADPVLAQRRTGYILGGISPLGQRHPSPVVVDESALSHSSILVSAGRRGLDVELAPGDLISATRASTALIAAPKPR